MPPGAGFDEGARRALSRRLARWQLLAASTFAAAPLLFARHLPFSDLPEHLGAIATLRYWFDPAYKSQEYFQVQGFFRTTYLLYHLVAAILAVPLGTVERANTLLLFAAAFAMVPSLAALLRAVRGEERLALVAAPLFWNRALAEGLVNYVASIPVALYALALAVEQARAPRKRRAVHLAALTAALFYLHTSSFAVFFVGAAAAVLLLRGHPAAAGRSWLLRAPWLLPSLALAPVLVVANVIASHGGGEHAGVVRFLPTRLLVITLFGWMHDVWTSRWDEASALVMWALVLLGVFASRRSRPRVLRRLAWVLAALGPAFYFLLPNQVSYAFILDLRMAPWIGLLGVLLFAPRRGAFARLVGHALFAVAAFHGVMTAHSMHLFEANEGRHFDRVLRNLPPGKRLLTLVFHVPSQYVHITPFVHFGSYYRARYGGVAGFSFSELPHWPVTYRPERAPPKKAVTFWDWNPCLFRNEKDGAYYDYVLVRGDVDPFASSPPGPRWRVIGASRDWVLFEKTKSPWIPNDGRVDPGPCPDSEAHHTNGTSARRPGG